MNAVCKLPLALCGLLLVAACEEPAIQPPETREATWDCEIPDRIASPVTISVVTDTVAGAARSVAVDKPVVVACVEDPLGWRADPATIAGWEIEWDGESPLADGVSPTGDARGAGEGQADTVGIFKYTVRVTTADGVQLELDPDAVIMSR